MRIDLYYLKDEGTVWIDTDQCEPHYIGPFVNMGAASEFAEYIRDGDPDARISARGVMDNHPREWMVPEIGKDGPVLTRNGPVAVTVTFVEEHVINDDAMPYGRLTDDDTEE